jgi:hypothetical protein
MMVSENLIQWLANGERGVSSKTIVHYVTGLDMGKNFRPDHPYDPDDMTRCIKLLERCPELVPGFREKMPRVSGTWARLAEHWDELVASLDAEIPGWRDGARGRAPKTYEMMQNLRGRS